MKKILLLSLLFSSIFTQAQVGFGTPTPDASSEVEINSTNKGILIPRISLTALDQKLQSTINNANSLLIYNNGTDFPQGYYYWKAKIEGNTDNGSWVAVGSDVASMPKFFYMPSIVLPTTEDMVTAMANPNITYNAGVFTIDLYEIFKNQFDVPVKSSNETITATTNPNVSSLSSLVLTRAEYEYHVIYADKNVFPHGDINFLTGSTNLGKLTYKVNPDAIIRNGSFMNIVLKVKN